MIGKTVALMLAVATATATAGALPERPQPGRPAMLLLGTYHLANNHRDVANVPVEDVLAPARQREIEQLVAALARWHPTKVAIEWPLRDQAELDRRYADYRAGRLQLTANERDQIGLRLAARLGLPRVEAVNWNEAAPGDPADYAWDDWARADGQGTRFEAFRAEGQRTADAQGRTMRCTSVADWYRALNTPEVRREMNRPYFTIATFGDDQANPGAAWVGGWYARNLRIFNNLRAVSGAGDRVFVLFGAGHAFFLDQFARESGAFDVVDPRAYLPADTGPRRCAG